MSRPRGSAYGVPALCLLAALAALPAHAQTPRGEVFGGFLAGKEIGRRNCSPWRRHHHTVRAVEAGMERIVRRAHVRPLVAGRRRVRAA